MKTKKYIIVLLFIFLAASMHASPKPDFQIVSSNSGYFEVEFTPQYLSDGVSFSNMLNDNGKFGNPDLGYRVFPLFLPSNNNNNVEIIDIKYSEVYNKDIKPVGTPKKDKEKFIESDYVKNAGVYSKNTFYPGGFATIENGGVLRDKYFGFVKVYPSIYNPVTKVLQKVSYIRIRVKFGNSPILSNKTLSKEEISLFMQSALNASVALKWSTPENNKNQKSVINSVLSTGDFYKIEVKETGMYMVDKNFLQSVGINTNSIDPATLKLYNDGGAELPYDNFIPVFNDLNEVKISVNVDGNGKLDNLIFFGMSPNDWIYNNTSKTWKHTQNHYSNSNYYWLTFGGSNGQRMTAMTSTSIPGITPLPNYSDKFFDKPEIVNLGSTGTLWLSQRISNNENFLFSKNLPGYVPGSNINLAIRFGNASSSAAYFQLEDNNSSLMKVYLLSGVSGFSHIILNEAFETYTLNSGTSMNLKLSLPSSLNSSDVQGYYDYYEVQYQRSLNSVTNNSIRIFAPDTTGTVEYQVSGFSSPLAKIYDMSDFSNPVIINPISYNSGVIRFQDNYMLGNVKQYEITGTDSYKQPVSISQKYSNQNIHGISDGASFIIISPTEFLDAANRLKSYREQAGPNYLKTYIFDVNQVYNEFSSGRLDPIAIRNFLKYAFNNWQIRPIYVLFLGDGSYDFKNIYNLNVKNWLPTVQRPNDESNEIVSYPSDDFITEINESFPSPDPGRPDFASGRICVNSLTDANIVINKIFDYESSASNGIWKKKILYVADDGWTTENTQGQEGSIHTDQCERIAELFTQPDFEKDKVYIVTYPAVITPQGRRKPGANVDIIKSWNEGRLVINYVGHGSTDLWAHEHVFVRDESIPQLNNKNKYPFVTIASCDLARWDDPFAVSAAEQLVFIQDKGAIAVDAAVRPVYSTPNAAFNETLWNNFMKVKDTLNLPMRLGTAMYNTKNQLGIISDNDVKFCLIGDPTLRLNIPQYFTIVDSINNVTGIDTAEIKALQKVRIAGRILRPDSSFWNNYNGEIKLKVFDVNKHIDFVDFVIYHFVFQLEGGIIFSGKANVVNGNWNLEFIVPKDISYSPGTGKILAYFSDNTTEGTGYSNRFRMNGIDTNAVKDTTGPQITTYMDSRNFRSGDMINQNSKIIADFFDVSGMNLTGTIGHKIEAMINNNESSKIDLTPYFNSTSGYQYGTLEYPIQNLAEGKYSLKIKAFDTYNNFSESVIDFTVKNNTSFAFTDVYNYPNPMKDFTTFIFQHNWDSPINVNIKVYTVSGRMIKEFNRTNITEKNVMIDWNGLDADGDAIANGVYLYKIIIKSLDGSVNTTSIQKLAKLK